MALSMLRLSLADTSARMQACCIANLCIYTAVTTRLGRSNLLAMSSLMAVLSQFLMN